MKASLLTLILLFTAGVAQAQLYNFAKLSEDGRSIEIGAIYGGCPDRYEFRVEKEVCKESHPVQCTLRIHAKDNGREQCHYDALYNQTLSFSLQELGLDSESYSNAAIEIVADVNSPSGPSHQSFDGIRLPEYDPCLQFSDSIEQLVNLWKSASSEVEKDTYRGLIQGLQRRQIEANCPVAIEPSQKNSVGAKKFGNAK